MSFSRDKTFLCETFCSCYLLWLSKNSYLYVYIYICVCVILNSLSLESLWLSVAAFFVSHSYYWIALVNTIHLKRHLCRNVISKGLGTPSVGAAGFLDLRTFKISFTVVYALFILVIYSHADLARRDNLLYDDHIWKWPRAARIPRTAWDLADQKLRGLRSQRRPWIIDNEERWERKQTMTLMKKKASRRVAARATEKRIAGTACLFAFRDGIYGLLALEYKKSWRTKSTSNALRTNTLWFLNVATKHTFRSHRRVSFPQLRIF